MNILRMKDLKELIGEYEGPCVSIYMPTHRSGKEVEQDPIRFKNLVRQAITQLEELGMRSADAREMLSVTDPLLEDIMFWRHQSDGLAVFVCRDKKSFHQFRLPFSFPELVVAGDRLHIKPLVPVITNDGKFYILAISQDRVRILQGTRDSVAEVDLEDIPSSLAEALRFEQPQKQLQFHTGSPGQGGRRDAMFFGAGDADPDVKNEILRYFQQVDRGVIELLKEEQVPLILAGVEYVFPIYREASKYQHIAEQGIAGNPDETSAKELHEKAWEIIRPHFKEQQRKAIERVEEVLGSDRKDGSSSFMEIVPAAQQARIETLLVPYGVQQWGTYDPETATVELHDERQPGDQDLLDYAVTHTLATGGSVYAMEPENVPGDGGVAAIFRYAIKSGATE